MDCFDPGAALAYVAGRLPADEARTLREHTAGCQSCRDLVSQTRATVDQLPPRSSDGDGLAVGARVGRYRVAERIGAGGQGVVYLARDPALNRPVSIKLLRPMASASGQERLIREARALAALSHPNVLAIYDIGDYQDQTFIAVEYIDGTTLAEWLRAPRSLLEVLEVFVAAGRGLAAAHEAGLVHRDFKPQNVLVGDDGRIKVADFGIVRRADAKEDDQTVPRSAVEPHLTNPGGTPGTPGYMAPEVLGGETASRASDQYSFCVSLREALSGPGRSPEDHLPRSAPEVLKRGLSPDPAERYQSMAELVEDLEQVVVRIQRPFLFGLPPTSGAGTQRRRVEALVQYVRDRFGYSLESIFAADYRALADDLVAGRVDVAWLSPLTFVQSAERGTHSLGTMRRRGQRDYHGTFAVLADSPLRELGDLAGKRIGWVDEDSASGYVFPRGLLASQCDNVDEFLAEQQYFGSHAAVVEAVARGWVDAGATFVRYDDAGGIVGAGWIERPERYRGVGLTPLIPGGDVIGYRAGLNEWEIELARTTMHSLTLDPEARPLVEAVFGEVEGFDDVDPESCERLLELLQRSR